MIIVTVEQHQNKQDGRWAGWAVVWCGPGGTWTHSAVLSKKDALSRAEDHADQLNAIRVPAAFRMPKTVPCPNCEGKGEVLQHPACAKAEEEKG